MKILIVDDNEQNLELLRFLLQRTGKSMILEASNGDEAVVIAREHVPSLIIMDIEMPVMDGIEALKILKSQPATSGVPVVAFTGRTSADDRELLLNEGFDGYLPKPTNLKEFTVTVGEFLPNSPQII